MLLTTESVWKSLRAELAGFFRHRVGDEHLAEDLLQETFVRVHDGIDDLAREDRLVPWVYRVARNVLVDHLRRERPRESVDVDPPAGEDPAEDNFNEDVHRWLLSMISLLPPEYREAIELVEVDGVSQKDVAERLGLSLSGAKSRVQRGRRRLRALLSDCCHLDFDRHGNVLGYTPRRRSRTCGEC